VRAGNYDATTTPLGTAWDGLTWPDSLNHAAKDAPPFWCRNTVGSGGPVCNYATAGHGVGALWDGTCKLPAQARFEGGPCL